MKRLLIFLGILAASACTRSNEGFLINAQVAHAEGYRVAIYNAENRIIDSTIVRNGKFQSKGYLEQPQQCYLCIEQPRSDGKNVFQYQIYIENRKMELTADAAVKDGDFRVKGAPIHEQFLALKRKADSLPEKAEWETNRKNKWAAAREKDKEKTAFYDREFLQIKTRMMNKIMDEPGAGHSPAVAAYISTMLFGMDLEDMIHFEQRFARDFDDYYLQKIRNDIELEKGVAIGHAAPHFELQDFDGNTYTPDSFHGKYVYMVFSASWCGWCRKEVPFIREAYRRFKGKDIVFITISMDETRENWEKMTKEENIEWMTISNLQGMDSQLRKDYRIIGIPAVFILDKEGRILMKKIRREELVPTLEKLL